PTPFTLHPTPYTLHRTLETRRPPFTLYPAPCTLHPTPYTLHPQPSTLNPQPSTLNPEPSPRATNKLAAAILRQLGLGGDKVQAVLRLSVKQVTSLETANITQHTANPKPSGAAPLG
ncbi:hypothetical protein T484DRAFT_1627410, partial [Baffinella frigidus]